MTIILGITLAIELSLGIMLIFSDTDGDIEAFQRVLDQSRGV